MVGRVLRAGFSPRLLAQGAVVALVTAALTRLEIDSTRRGFQMGLAAARHPSAQPAGAEV